MTRPTPERDVTGAVVSLLNTGGLGIEPKDGERITFLAVQSNDPIEDLAIDSAAFPIGFVRMEGALPGETNDIVAYCTFNLTMAVYAFYRRAVQREAEMSAWDVGFRIAQVIGEEVAKPGGAAGETNTGAHLFGLTGTRNRITNADPAKGITVTHVREGIVRVRVEFQVEYRLDITGGTD